MKTSPLSSDTASPTVSVQDGNARMARQARKNPASFIKTGLLNNLLSDKILSSSAVFISAGETHQSGPDAGDSLDGIIAGFYLSTNGVGSQLI